MRKTLALCALTTVYAVMATGAVLHDNGTFNSLGGNGMGDARQADDFIISGGPQTITGVQFWTLEATGSYLGSLEWWFMNDAAGEPGGVVASGTATPTRTNVGTALGLDIIHNVFSVSVPNVAVGTYWLALHNGGASDIDFQDMYWSWADILVGNSSTARGREYIVPGGPTWDTNDQEHAFLIEGQPFSNQVPEPGTLLLLPAGLAALWLRRRNS